MPTYEYECPACGELFERFEPITSLGRAKCPACGKRARRLIGAGAGLLFRGSGFYSTDYRSESYKSAEKGEKEKGGAGKAESVGAAREPPPRREEAPEGKGEKVERKSSSPSE